MEVVEGSKTRGWETMNWSEELQNPTFILEATTGNDVVGVDVLLMKPDMESKSPTIEKSNRDCIIGTGTNEVSLIQSENCDDDGGRTSWR